MFMALVLDAIHMREYNLAKTKADVADWKMQIDCEAENKVVLYYLQTMGDVDMTMKFSFKYQSGYIHINNKYFIDFRGNRRVGNEDKMEATLSKLTDAETNGLIEFLTKNIMKEFLLFTKMISCFPYMFNTITCLNVSTGKVEPIHLSSYYDILTLEKYKIQDLEIERLGNHTMVYSDKDDTCLVNSKNRNGYGNIYTLSADKITELKPTRVETTWIPICAIEKRTNLPLNKIIVLQDAQNAESQPEYLYMSTKGVFYNGEIVSATIGYEDRIIIYKDGNVLITACTLDTGTVAIAHCVGDSDTIKEYNIKALEEISEANNIESLQPFTSQLAELADDVIFDGSKFLPFNDNWDKLVKKQPTKQQNKDKQEESKQGESQQNESKQDESQQDESKQNQKPKAWQIILLIIALLLLLL
ncbi:MAG: hypothetical protein IKM50_02465 [Tidjanibacter sp.]|nr:hypothetical protein [Tidjanibacter sp.]